MKPEKSLDLLAIGEALCEFNDGPNGTLRGYGGDTSNVVIAAARHGARAGYFTAVGNDPFGKSLLALWHRERVDTTFVRCVDNAPTGIYFITHDENGHHFHYRRADSAASRIGPNDLPVELIARARILHVSAISQAISTSACDAIFAALEIAREQQTTISYDTNLRLNLWPLPRAKAIILAALRTADIALPSLEDARALSGIRDSNAIVDYFLTLGPSIVALTLGADGVLVATGSRRERISAIPIDSVDATGAGDAFDGSFLADWLRHNDPFVAARYANAVAGLSTKVPGAVAGIPKRDELPENLLDSP